MKFAVKLRSLREEKGWSQRQLAVEAKTSQQAVALWESGDRIPAFDAVQSLCTALGVECTIFNGCTHAEVDAKRGRGRPPKAVEPEAAPATPKKKPSRRRR